jgi:hypothetical protein
LKNNAPLIRELISAYPAYVIRSVNDGVDCENDGENDSKDNSSDDGEDHGEITVRYRQTWGDLKKRLVVRVPFHRNKTACVKANEKCHISAREDDQIVKVKMTDESQPNAPFQ